MKYGWLDMYEANGKIERDDGDELFAMDWMNAAEERATRIKKLERQNAEMREFIGDLLGERVRVYRVLHGDGGRTIWSIQPESIYHKYPWLEAYLDR